MSVPAAEAAAGSAARPTATPSHPGRDPRRLLLAAAPLLAGAVAFGLARTILLPDHGFWDTAEFQAVAPLFGTAHPTGYPTYVILGWLASLALAPLGEPAFRMNLLSALLLGLAAGLLTVLVRGMTGRTSIALAAGVLLALTPVPWRMGGFADPHTLHLTLVAGLAVLLTAWERRVRAGDAGADRWLIAAAVVFGAMLGNHSLTLLLAPGIALFVVAVEPGIFRRPRLVARYAVALLATATLLYLQLPLRAAMGAPLVYGHPDTLEGFLYVVTGQQFRGDVVDPFGDLGAKLAGVAGVAIDQLGPLAALLPAAFLVVAARRPRFALLTGTWAAFTCWFASAYTNADIERYYLGPVLLAIAWLAIAAGVIVGGAGDEGGPPGATGDAPAQGEAVATPRSRAGDVVPRIVAIALSAALLASAVLAAPTTASLVDRSRDTRAPEWTCWALETVGPDAVLVTWWSFSTPLWYRTLVLGERPDVRVVDDRDRLDEGLGSVEDVIRAYLPDHLVYLVRLPAEIAALESRWLLEPIPDPLGIQPLHRVVAPRPVPGARGAEPVPAVDHGARSRSGASTPPRRAPAASIQP